MSHGVGRELPPVASDSRQEQPNLLAYDLFTGVPRVFVKFAHRYRRVVMQRFKSLLWITATLALAFFCARATGLFRLATVAAQSSGDSVIYLDQAWSQAD